MLKHIEEYHYAESAEDAVRILRDDGASVIAGGTILVASGAPGCRVLVDISRAGLGGIRTSDEGLTLGATTTLQELMDSPLVPAAIGEAARASFGHLMRNATTLGGLVAAVPLECDVLTVLLALDARLSLLGPDGERSLALDNHLRAPSGSVSRGEVITQIFLPSGGKVAYGRVSRGTPDRSTVSAAVWKGEKAIRVALGGMTARPYRLHNVETAVSGGLAIESLADVVMSAATAQSDFLATSDYRREVAGVLVRRAFDRLS